MLNLDCFLQAVQVSVVEVRELTWWLVKTSVLGVGMEYAGGGVGLTHIVVATLANKEPNVAPVLAAMSGGHSAAATCGGCVGCWCWVAIVSAIAIATCSEISSS